jgi:hypothetical protein
VDGLAGAGTGRGGEEAPNGHHLEDGRGENGHHGEWREEEGEERMEEEEEGKEDEAKERTKIFISIMPNEQQIKEVSWN